jgi:cell division protein FtsB
MAAVMLIVGCLSCYRQTTSELNAAAAEKQAEALRVDNLRIQTERLKAELDRLKSDPKAIESLARENLGFVRPGEIVIRIRPDRGR